MKINIPKVVLQVNLGGYAPELEGRCLFVWVNPPLEKLNAYEDLKTALQEEELAKAKKVFSDAEGGEQQAEDSKQPSLMRTVAQVARMLKFKRDDKGDGIDERLLLWYAEIWSCGPEDTRWTVAELRELERQDPAFLSWMIAQTWDVRSEHIQRKKKS